MIKKHKEIEYKIELGEDGCIHAETIGSIELTGYGYDYNKCKESIEKDIDKYVASRTPESMPKLLDMIQSYCFRWTGYEECELNRSEASDFIERYINNENKID